MSKNKFPITELAISDRIGRTIKSPILVGALENIGISSNEFIDYFSPFFTELEWDKYDMRRLQIEFLLEKFPIDESAIKRYFKDYFTEKKGISIYQKWIRLLSPVDLVSFEQIQAWRKRSVAQFLVEETKNGIVITREKVEQFIQEVAEDDFRSLPRVFAEAPAIHVENDLFYQLVRQLFSIVQNARIGTKKLKMTAHFMSVKATQSHPGDNSPEGAHEDGADYIISALVINRKNLIGGESQIIELRENGQKEIIYKRTLQPGEFIFQADSRDEIVYGTDLWHHVTPFYLDNPQLGEGWRDIIGFDINIS